MARVLLSLACILLSLVFLPAALAERQQIGRAPNNPDKVIPLSGLSWEESDGRISITVKTQDGNALDVGTFPSAVVFPALMFAADGRPYVVSVEKAPPLFDQKVLLHPVLQDTALGCRLLQIDRLAGALRERDADLAARITEVEEGLLAQNALYELTWGIRVMTALAAIQSDQDGAGVLRGAPGFGSVRQSLSFADRVTKAGPTHIAPYWQRLAGSQSSGDTLALLRAKPNYFHRDVTAVTSKCLSTAQDPATFIGCVQQQTVDGLIPMLNNRNLIWGAPPPTWNIAYGIGEVGFDLDNTLSAFASSSTDARTNFVAWVSFRSLPNFLESTGAPWYSAENTAILSYQDRQPFVLSELEAPLSQSVDALFDSSLYWQTSREALESFTVLQRLFRLGFEERFGPNFAIEQFTELGQETSSAAFKENYRTPRWLAAPGALEEQAYFIAKDLAEATGLGRYAPLGTQAQVCVDLLSQTGLYDTSKIPELQWTKTCDPERMMSDFTALKGRPDALDDTGYFVQRNVLNMIRLSYARKIRKELDVFRDEAFDLSGEVCPIP